jgi:GH25 family lysozyme M1 (1,4-beta-N-acetylmuramidase)
MKELLEGLAGKLAGVGKSVFVAHAKICIITGAVAVSGTAATVAGVEYVKHNNTNNVVQAQETEHESETETESERLDKLNKILAETQEETAEEESSSAEELESLMEEALSSDDTTSEELNQIIEAVADSGAGPVAVKDIEELEVVEDNSSEPSREDAEVSDSGTEETSSSDQIYEVNQLVYGIDVSRWQGDIDWSKVAADGITFAMIKCGGGDDGLYEDRKFKQNIQGALANGIQVGIYFYSGATDAKTAYDEASFCINLIKDYQITYPVAFDWELDGDYDSVTEACETFCNVIKSYGYQPMVYSNRNRWYNNFNGEKLSNKFKVWMAAYWSEYYYTSTRWTYGDDLASFKWHYDMWQYGVTDTVDGIDGYVDMNIAFFGYANYKVNGAQDAALTVTNTNITRYLGHDSEKLNEGVDFMSGVKGVNSIGYEMDVDYDIINSSGNSVDEEDALSQPGRYTVRYSFKDPKSGNITKDAVLNIVDVTAKLVTPDINVQSDVSGRLPAGFSFVNGVSGTNSLSENATLTQYEVIERNIATGEEITMSPEQALSNVYDVKNYTYSVVYYFDVPKDGTVKQTAVMTVIAKETETEKETQKETESESQTESVSESQTETRKLSVAAKKQETTEETVINNK